MRVFLMSRVSNICFWWISKSWTKKRVGRQSKIKTMCSRRSFERSSLYWRASL